MTPNMIIALLTYYSGLENAVVFTESDDWFNNAVENLIGAGMLDLGSKQPVVTAKAEAFVRMLTNTPLPIQAWVDPRDMNRGADE